MKEIMEYDQKQLEKQPKATPEDMVPGVLFYNHDKQKWWHACARCGALGQLSHIVVLDGGGWPSVVASVVCGNNWNCHAHYWYSDLSMAISEGFPEARGGEGFVLRQEIYAYIRPRATNYLEWFRFWHTPLKARKKITPFQLLTEGKNDKI